MRAILATIGVLAGGVPPVSGRFTRHDGTSAEVTRAASVTGEGRPGAADPGFGLTVAEGMWKGRPVIGSAVGGIQDQIVDGTGVLLRDPADLATFGSKVRWLLDNRDTAERMGRAAHAYVREHYLDGRHLLQYAGLFGAVIDGQGIGCRPPGMDAARPGETCAARRLPSAYVDGELLVSIC